MVGLLGTSMQMEPLCFSCEYIFTYLDLYSTDSTKLLGNNLDTWNVNIHINDGNCLYGICITMGPNEFLGSNQ